MTGENPKIIEKRMIKVDKEHQFTFSHRFNKGLFFCLCVRLT